MWYCANGVNRTHRCTYGVEVDVPFDQGNAEHCERAAFVGFNETCAIKGAWFPLVLKVTIVSIIMCLQLSDYPVFMYLRVQSLTTKTLSVGPTRLHIRAPTWI